VIADGTADELKDRIGGEHVRLVVADPSSADKTLEVLQSICTGAVERDGDGVTFEAPVRAHDRMVPNLIRALDDAGVDVVDIEVRRPTLDDVFLTLTGHTADDEGAGS
jgi:ABC-2 type transport system ATP-binding protein